MQGEGVLLGVPMVFVRLGGCSIGCDGCDTDYRVTRRVSAEELSEEVGRVRGSSKWVWITGGEPTDHDLKPLVELLRKFGGVRIAVATAGMKPVQMGLSWGGVDFVSVSPHRIDGGWLLRRGDQVNLVPGLNGLTLAQIAEADDAGEFSGFAHRFVTPFADREGRSEKVKECVEFVSTRKDWRLGIQAHKQWGVA